MTEFALAVPPRCFYKWAQTWPCCLQHLGAPTHLPLSRPYCWSKAYLQKDISHDRCTCYKP